MKPVLTRPLSHHLLLFRPTSTTTTTTSISFSTSNLSINTPSLHTLSSFLLLTSTPTTIPTSPSPLNPQSNELPNTHFPSSPTQPNPTSLDPSPPQFTHTWPVSSPRSDPFSKFIHPVDPSPSNTHFLISPNQPTPHHQFTHRRPFSSARSDPSSIEPPPPNEIPVVSTVTSPFDSSASIDAGSSIRKPISLWPGIYHSPVTNALWEARSSIFEKPQELPIGDASESELVPKTPAQSRTSIIYKFSSDYILREQYRNPWNEIRTGKLLEDLDALAGTISVKHCCNEDSTTRPLLLVTASVDRIVLKKPIRVDTDLKIVGAVTWVGRSSMEIRLEVIQPTQEVSKPSDSLALTANFTFVARDSKTGKSAPINQISPETQQEKLLWREAEERNQIRKKKKGENKKDINDREADRLKALLAEGRVFCDMPALADRDSILIKDTRLEYSFICQPQQRNIHGRIFGGFLMRKAFELAFSTTYAFAGAAPLFLEVDHVDFLKPVDVGNFLRLKSCVLYTELENLTQPLINVEVVAHVTSPELRSSEVSNTFYFTFTVRPEATKNGLKIRNVVPASEEEARRVLERVDAENPELVQTRNRVII